MMYQTYHFIHLLTILHSFITYLKKKEDFDRPYNYNGGNVAQVRRACGKKSHTLKS
jgi:hypothetical protein